MLFAKPEAICLRGGNCNFTIRTAVRSSRETFRAVVTVREMTSCTVVTAERDISRAALFTIVKFLINIGILFHLDFS